MGVEAMKRKRAAAVAVVTATVMLLSMVVTGCPLMGFITGVTDPELGLGDITANGRRRGADGLGLEELVMRNLNLMFYLQESVVAGI
jgi:hypothetical protein